MPRRALLAVLLLSGLAGVAGCGAGSSTQTGRVSDVDGRLCLQTNPDDGTCYVATAEQLAPLTVGTCVEVTYRPVNGLAPDATAVRVVDPPCFGPVP